jgi:hypothetical protein
MSMRPFSALPRSWSARRISVGKFMNFTGARPLTKGVG